jgi:hypothetical protein
MQIQNSKEPAMMRLHSVSAATMGVCGRRRMEQTLYYYQQSSVSCYTENIFLGS